MKKNPIRNQETHVANGYVFCRYRRVKNSDRLLDAREYGYQAWRIPISSKKH